MNGFGTGNGTSASDTAHSLEAAADLRGGFSAVVGFDGFVDTIFRPVRRKTDKGTPDFFRSIPEFSEFLKGAAGRSADIEIVLQEERLGGNAPILARALSSFGIPTLCAAPLGKDGLDPAFCELEGRCGVFNLGVPARTTAFEFEDGKLMFGDAASLHSLDWKSIETADSTGDFRSRLRSADLICLVDWSYLHQLDGIVDGIERELDRDGGTPSKTLFFDLADPTTRSMAELGGFLGRIGRLSPRHRTVLGLNEKEAAAASGALEGTEALSTDGPEMDALMIRKRTGIGEVVVHGLDYAIAADCDGTVRVAGHRVERPRISIGGGDNFNAGYCLGLLLGISMEQRLEVATTVSGLYVELGRYALFNELVESLAARRGR